MSGEISRRVTLAWVAAASLAGCETREQARQIDPPPVADAPPVADTAPDLWKEVALEPVTAPGYGHDPHLTSPSVPWPLTLDADQRASLRLAADLILPAEAHSPSGGSLQVDAFIDEWVSAPYPDQQRDRVLVVSGLVWLDAESKHRFGADFRQITDAQRRTIFDSIAFRDKVAPGLERPARFFARLRGLMLAGYYSAPEGVADLGYMGNAPYEGDYPGPTPEAKAHLNASLTRLGLNTVG